MKSVMVIAKGQVKGEAKQSKLGFWFFRSDEKVPLEIAPTETLKELGRQIEVALRVKVKFREALSRTPQKAKRSPARSKGSFRKKLSGEQWLALERKSAKCSPRAVSIECRSDRSSIGRRARSVEGGLPGLGKRR